ncbi:hypothetical protein HUU05_08890 [candidate division KSB1 bacterium]|nr:hypothetical protein [candidate division KSB1 bacterium]
MNAKTTSLWRAIAVDNLSGASEIYARVLQLFMQHLSLLDQTKAALQEWPQWLRALLQAQPAMAPLYNLANNLALIFEQESLSEKERIAQALALLHKEILQSPQANAAIAQHAFPLLAEKPRVLTHSYSSTVAAVLENAHAKGVKVEVYLSEGRPANEGRRMAERLARAGMPVHFFVDDARACFVNTVDLVLLGADWISEKAFVNKIGSRSLALLASVLKIPVVVLAGQNKLWPTYLPLGQEPEQPHAEIWAEAPPNVKPHNFYFEDIELHHAYSVITEGGLASLERVQNELLNFHAAEFWRRL